ncbi:MAG: hypothetical protein DI551_11105 [Micavibrio aeruginosavorus]|uniref:Uncharacterized protein n=1 Tax=Micavibrio aeruginosavorus TaxID=349221 RepID=A0A2W5MU88_9BACT|nr:MAG: hypothetical protein DI551_11105 [Micavibrio aeruginosavorus]
MYSSTKKYIRALQVDDLLYRTVIVDAENHFDWFSSASEGSDLKITDEFRVRAVERYGDSTWLRFSTMDGMRGGAGEIERFLVLAAKPDAAP